jgi:hypothetical protein
LITWGGNEDNYLIDFEFDNLNNNYMLTEKYLVKNPQDNGKSLENTNLFTFYILGFTISGALSTVAFIILFRKRRIKND